jgi:hypothetical protein
MTYTPERVTDTVERGLALLLEQFKGKPLLEGLLSSYLAQVQKLEDCAWEVIDHTALEDLEGQALDDLGVLLRRGRDDLSDDDYRIALRAQIRINRSSGTTVDLQDVAILSVPDGTALAYDEYYPATVRFKIVGDSSAVNLSTFWVNLKATKLGGVRLFVEYGVTADEDMFAFAPTTAGATDSNKGWGDAVAGGVGGRLASVIG